MSALDTLKAFKVSLSFLADQKIQKERIKTCYGCQEYKHGVCVKCGCIMLVKTRLADEKCPLGKWR